jgi:GNAT superfamily N-acetyltransferase
VLDRSTVWVVNTHPLRTILEDAARGRFPPQDGEVRIVPPAPGRSDAVVAFTSHHLIAADVDVEEVRCHLPDGDLAAPLSPAFLAWLGDRIESAPGSVDVVLAASGRAAGPDDPPLRLAGATSHDRVERAGRYRDDVAVYADADGVGVIALGSGLAGRHELAVEIDEAARGRGLGRRLILAARALVPPEEFVFAQVAPGNAASLRAFLAAGFAPVGSEVLLLRGAGRRG